jgi:hypothetical protein
MKIEVGLNKQSIKNAIKQLNAIKKTVPKMQQEFLMEVAHWLTDRANDYITNSDLGSLVKDQIRSSWSYEPTANGVKIVNNAQKQVTNFGTVPLAVLVEFGVGIVGGGQPHPQASNEGYQYNVKSRAKFLGGSWSFRGQMETLDLPQDSVDYAGSDDELVFITQGAKGVWYAYNAIVDAQTELAKANGGAIGKLWNDVKKRYIK